MSRAKALRRIAAFSLTAIAVLPGGSAQGASFFKSDTGKTSIEVHVDNREIIFLRHTVPISCSSGDSRDRTISTRIPISLNHRTGAFSTAAQGYDKWGAYHRDGFKGTIFNGRLNATYSYGYSSGYGQFCWSGAALRGTPSAPEGSPVRFLVSRQKGVRFFKDSSLGSRRETIATYFPGYVRPVVYMWIGNGRVYGLTAVLPFTCVNHDPGYPNSSSDFDVIIAPGGVIRVKTRTHRIRFRHVERFVTGNRTARLSAVVGPHSVRGQVSSTSDYESPGSGSTQHCQTGGRGDPGVPFAAARS
jgi:hypothetical protein